MYVLKLEVLTTSSAISETVSDSSTIVIVAPLLFILKIKTFAVSAARLEQIATDGLFDREKFYWLPN